MKKLLSTAIAAVLACGICSCSKNSESSDSSENSAKQQETSVVSVIPETTEAENSEAQEAAEESDIPATEPAAESPAAPETETDAAAYHFDDGGAIVFDQSAAQQPESVLVAAAQELFESACNTYWRFTVGSPYSLDTSEFIENQYGWQFYLVTEEGMNSVADVKADYHRVFSQRYPDEIDETFADNDGRVYCLDGARGADIYYDRSEVISLDSQSGDEYFFTVRNYYDGSAWGDEPYYEDETFSAVDEGDGTWRAGTFRLPY